MALLQINFSSESLEHSTNISVIYPSYTKKKKVLFLFHGYSGSQLDWIRYSSIERLVNQYGVTVVMPEINNSYYTNMKYGANYFDYVSIELHKFISDLLNVELTNENTFIGGLSMGGYGALKSAFTYPEKYKAVFGLSSVTNIKEMYNIMKNENRQRMLLGTFGELNEIKDSECLFELTKGKSFKDLNIYIACGTNDFLFEMNEKFNKHLNDNNIKHEYVFNEGEHSWDYWDYNIKEVFKKLF